MTAPLTHYLNQRAHDLNAEPSNRHAKRWTGEPLRRRERIDYQNALRELICWHECLAERLNSKQSYNIEKHEGDATVGSSLTRQQGSLWSPTISAW